MGARTPYLVTTTSRKWTLQHIPFIFWGGGALRAASLTEEENKSSANLRGAYCHSQRWPRANVAWSWDNWGGVVRLAGRSSPVFGRGIFFCLGTGRWITMIIQAFCQCPYFKNLNWRYLPYIRPIFQAYIPIDHMCLGIIRWNNIEFAHNLPRQSLTFVTGSFRPF